MNYAIKKTTDGKFPRIIHRFTQEENNHRAKAAARAKLNEMWLRVLQRPGIMKDGSIEGDKDAFSTCWVSASTSAYASISTSCELTQVTQ